jgi:hypothetical protein
LRNLKIKKIQTLNNINYQINKVEKIIYLLPIENIHSEELVKETKLTLDVQFLDYDVHIDWQKD